MIKRFNDGRDWFFEKRFGLFVTWGIYAVHGWHEQEQFRKAMSREEYSVLKNQFNPAQFNPDEWLDLAEQAGMQYLCFTAKHIDGFCMWATAQTDYRITDTPYGRDVFGMLADACHRRNFPLCVYYSVPDMHCRYYPNQGRSYELPAPAAGDEPDIAKYIGYVKEQVRELCSNYGKIHGFWWDANQGTLKHHDASMNSLIRALQPGIIINNRGFDKGDFSTPEREAAYDRETQKQAVYEQPTEACDSVGRESWGFRSNEDYYSLAYLSRSIAKHLAKGGNYLLNVGPQADGTFSDQAVKILKALGKWYHGVKEALVNAAPASGTVNDPGLLVTKKDDFLYIHLCLKPDCSGVSLCPLAILPDRATVLNNGKEITAEIEMMPDHYGTRARGLHLFNIPVDEFANQAIVLKLEFPSAESRF
ncbi:MAG: alpha-L-fucosidase [Verrucomicrobiota bacterium]